LNKEKSVILQARVDGRTRTRELEIGIKRQCRYLGVLIDDSLRFQEESKSLLKQLLKQQNTLEKIHINIPNSKYIVWKTLIESRVMHKLLIVSRFQTKKTNVCLKFLSDSMKQLMGIKQKVKTSKLLQITLIDI
jgi:hypothetical protein